MAEKEGSAVRIELPVWLAYVLLIATALCWAGSSVAGRAAAGNVPPYTLSFIRWFAAFLVFLPFGGATLWRQRAILARNFPLMCAFSLFGVIGFTVPYYVGLQYTAAVNAALLNGSGPIMILIIAYFMVGSRVSGAQAAGIALSLAGTVIVVFRGDVVAGLLAVRINTGDLLVLSSFFSWSMYTVMLRWRPAGMGQMAFLIAMCGMAWLVMLPMFLWESARGGLFEATAGNLTIIVYAALFPSVIAYVFWNLAVQRLDAHRAGITQYLIPVFGIMLSVLILGETVAWHHLAGTACIFTGIYLATTTRQQ